MGFGQVHGLRDAWQGQFHALILVVEVIPKLRQSLRHIGGRERSLTGLPRQGRAFLADTATFDWLVERVQCYNPRRPEAQIRGSLLNNLKPPSRSAGGPSRTPVLSVPGGAGGAQGGAVGGGKGRRGKTNAHFTPRAARIAPLGGVGEVKRCRAGGVQPA